MLWLGVFAFIFFFLSDVNDCKFKKKALAACFPLGALMLSAATVVSCVKNASPFSTVVKTAAIITGVIFFVLMIWALFFSMPVGDAYIERNEGRRVNTNGLYALCRHPGVLFFIPLYICISFAFGLPFYEAAAYSVLNILLIVFEDIYVFPRVLCGYNEYKTNTPFLFPNKRGIKRFLDHYKKV